MKRKKINSQQMGLFILILLLLLGWGLNLLSSLQGDLGPIRKANEVFILITGEVKNPGVYGFDREPCLKELMVRAGGPVHLRWRGKGDKYTSLTQGTSVHISSENGYMEVLTGSIPSAYKVTLRVPISLNTATQEELETIPGIGPSLAMKILKYRSHYGPFETVGELKSIPGMGKCRYLKVEPYIGT